MSVQNPERVVTKQDLADFYGEILPYLGGKAEAGFTPIGTVISVMGNSAPANYLVCDGTVYDISSYLELAIYFEQQFGSKNYFGGNGTTTFAVPDLRGEFLRGTGTNSHANQGKGANVGVHQDATQHLRIGGGSTNDLYMYPNNVSWLYETNADAYSTKATNAIRRTTLATSDNQENATYYMARPTNTSVLWCIATKNIYLNPSLDYSTDEKIVGSWIDGKPIYQKTFSYAEQIVIPADGTALDVLFADVTSLNVAKVVDFEANYFSSGGNQLRGIGTCPIGDIGNKDTMSVVPFLEGYGDATQLLYMQVRRTNNSSVTLSDATITMRYTKTTD